MSLQTKQILEVNSTRLDRIIVDNSIWTPTMIKTFQISTRKRDEQQSLSHVYTRRLAKIGANASKTHQSIMFFSVRTPQNQKLICDYHIIHSISFDQSFSQSLAQQFATLILHLLGFPLLYKKNCTQI